MCGHKPREDNMTFNLSNLSNFNFNFIRDFNESEMKEYSFLIDDVPDEKLNNHFENEDTVKVHTEFRYEDRGRTILLKFEFDIKDETTGTRYTVVGECNHRSTLYQKIHEWWQEYDEEEEEEEDEDEEDEEDVVPTTDKIKKMCDFSVFMIYKIDIPGDIKRNICNDKKKGDKLHIIYKLTTKAIADKDFELYNRMEEKRKEFVFEMMEDLEKHKDVITDNQYLIICNKLKELY
jgi:hypothetical protein